MGKVYRMTSTAHRVVRHEDVLKAVWSNSGCISLASAAPTNLEKDREKRFCIVRLIPGRKVRTKDLRNKKDKHDREIKRL
ncbi:hypothetical protein MRX96_034818 [Rhipicephalus microplus]